MYIFYTIAGTVIGILAFVMLAIRTVPGGDEGRKFKAAKRYLAAMFLLTGVSMFAAQFETRIPSHQFEKINASMLLFFFLIAHGFIYSILILYASRYATPRYFKRAVIPILPLFVLFLVLYFTKGDIDIYSFEEFREQIFINPQLILRSILLLCVIGSISYGAYLCHKAKNEYDRLIANYFSETDFARSIWLYNLVWCAEALAIWVVMTYFYTTPVLEVIVGLLIIAVFSFYIKEFRKYARRYDILRPALLFDHEETAQQEQSQTMRIEAREMPEIHQRVTAWIRREDKPFTQPKLTIGNVAQATGVPKYRLSVYINNRADNFCAWINMLRIEEAAELLRTSDLSITEIAEQTGFCDLPAFSRAFKKEKGASPRSFRQK